MFDWFRSKSGAKLPARRPEVLRPSLKKSPIWIPRHLLILFCYAYIIGIVAGMYVYRIPPSFLMYGYGALVISLLAAMMIGFLKRQHAWTAGAIALAATALGLVNYSRALDTSDPRHLVHFAGEGFDERVTLTGVVTSDPDIRERYTNLVVEPVTVETEEGETVRPSGGGVMVRLYPDSLDSYGDYAYGDSIQVRAPLVIPRRGANPGAFDYRQWLIERQGCYATMQVRRNSEIQRLGRNRTHFLVDFSLRMKEKILESIRLTMPYPESSFLGGVTLGLKGGVTQKTRFEFQSTGIAHVLAVSGLHVGFVAVLLLMLAHLFNLPEKFHPVFIVLGLIVFSIITGASPATVRAAIMFSMFICIRYYMTGLGLAASTLLTIPVAALAILLSNPLLVMDASFLLSFGAVLSLGLLTWPLQMVFNRLFVGFRLVAAGLTVVFLTWMAHAHWGMFFDRSTAPLIFGSLAILWAAAFLLQKKFPTAVPYGFTSIHPWIGSFIAAQVAINLGNSPLFALYFYRLSISGWYANFIAIPLCGIIVQLGILAGLFYMIPVVGPYLAAMINGGNFLFCAFFLGSATFFANHFPYPYVGTPSTEFAVVYYAVLALFVWHRPIWHRIKTVYTWWLYRKQVPEVRGKLYATLAVSVLLVSLPVFYVMGNASGPRLRIAILDVGQGSVTIIRTPSEKGILVDGAPYDGYRDFNAGQNIVAPALSDYGINVLDHVVLTSFKPEHMGGLPFLLRQFHVKEFVDCLPPELADAKTTWDTFAARLAKSPYAPLLESKFTDEIFESYRKVLEAVEEKRARRTHPSQGRVIHEEQTPYGILRVSTVALPDTGLSIPMRTALVKIEWGPTWSVLLTGDMTETEMALAAKTDSAALDAAVLLLPSHGQVFEKSFLSAVSPRYAVAQSRLPFRRRAAKPHGTEEELVNYFQKEGGTYFQTNKNGAILIESDGKRFSVRPYTP
ncbi:MAG: hypothetical protein A3G34_04200 [Candidatus Lindowbacteria bacterium RIFCSPLOWO2_12_FULL_62_27]|nr:MAG: hypothetical protein A3G34_04200 [Candidatus Lindowbacteria bacterium RIFCSPLOWO2_12_FULL_62_27]OGH63507.1 MAG: hypothetical protein A3I06_13555 [Candidatus Lindowbacteria bacterium RIFCSPLOWO2_02_FULL_62_12]